MSFSNQSQNRRSRRSGRSTGSQGGAPIHGTALPGPLRFLTNPALFLVMGLLFAGAIILSLFSGIINVGSSTGGSNQMNEISDEALAALVSTSTPTNGDTPDPNPTPVVKRYTQAPEMTIDTSKSYTATIATSKGDIVIELYPEAAPEAVNAFVFLAQDGYYNGTKFLQVSSTQDGTPFTAQAGDPTNTGLGTPGFDVNQEVTDQPFVKGAVGYDSGQFYIALGDFPSLTGKYSIIGQVTSGLDVLDQLSLLNVHTDATDAGDVVESVTVSEPGS